MDDFRRRLGSVGERLAEQYLVSRGLAVVDRNVRIGRSEVDLVAVDRGQRVAVEVRTSTNVDRPIMGIDGAKIAHVASLARQIGAERVDVIGVVVRPATVDIHWVIGAGW